MSARNNPPSTSLNPFHLNIPQPWIVRWCLSNHGLFSLAEESTRRCLSHNPPQRRGRSHMEHVCFALLPRNVGPACRHMSELSRSMPATQLMNWRSSQSESVICEALPFSAKLWIWQGWSCSRMCWVRTEKALATLANLASICVLTFSLWVSLREREEMQQDGLRSRRGQERTFQVRACKELDAS